MRLFIFVLLMTLLTGPAAASDINDVKNICSGMVEKSRKRQTTSDEIDGYKVRVAKNSTLTIESETGVLISKIESLTYEKYVECIERVAAAVGIDADKDAIYPRIVEGSIYLSCDESDYQTTGKAIEQIARKSFYQFDTFFAIEVQADAAGCYDEHGIEAGRSLENLPRYFPKPHDETHREFWIQLSDDKKEWWISFHSNGDMNWQGNNSVDTVSFSIPSMSGLKNRAVRRGGSGLVERYVAILVAEVEVARGIGGFEFKQITSEDAKKFLTYFKQILDK